ncbi:MAG: flagellar basal body rod protein FlgB [Clostridia bacterium]|nr:flagellar basal body rod protein FlgB [Clostridia bacterium]
MLEKIFSGAKTREKALNAALLRNEAISDNIANVDTPGYKRKIVAFEEFLSNAMDSGIKGKITDKKHIPIGGTKIDNVTPRIIEQNNSTNYRLDGNNVDIENEMAAMAKNTIQYNTLVQSLNGYFRKIKSVIKEGR